MSVSNVNKIKDDKVNFVCPWCQKIYYQADHEDFNQDPHKVTTEARMYKKHYHSCKPKGKVRKKPKGRSMSKGKSQRSISKRG